MRGVTATRDTSSAGVPPSEAGTTSWLTVTRSGSNFSSTRKLAVRPSCS